MANKATVSSGNGASNNNVTVNSSTSKKVDVGPFVVVRGGYRVSENEYDRADDASAIDECLFWQKVADKYSKKEKVQIVPLKK